MLTTYFFNNYIPCFVNTLVVIYIIKKILNSKIDINLFTILLLLILTLISTLNYIFVNENVRILSSTLIVIFFSFIIFKLNINKIILSVIFEQIVMFFSELIFAILLFLFADNEFNFFDFKGQLLTNIFICLIAIILINIRFVYIKILDMIDIVSKFKYFDKYFLSLIFISIMSILLLYIYNNGNLANLIANTILVFIYSIIIYKLISEKNQNIIFQKENNILINNLNEYEKMLDYQRVNNHENKNQLLVIKSMIEKKDKKLMEYINEIIKEKREDNEIIYNKAKRIPSGGLQGLIYQKMLLMQEKNIEVDLDINSKVRKIDFGNLSSKMNYDICRIVGIIIDNAIEETAKFNKKDREIIISMYVDDMFIIEVSNRIKDDLDLSKIYDKGYTSKEKGHGYGLSLLKKIVNENDNIINEVKIVNNIFTQVIKIKM